MKPVKIVLITGASSGIGEALAMEYARRGARLILAARRIDRLEKLQKRLEAGSHEALAVACDVTRDGDVEKAIDEGRRRFGRVDVVIANAGFGVVGGVEKLKLDDYRRQFETNIYGVLRTVQAAIPELRRNRGSLAIVGSVAGHISMPDASPYAMSKFAVRALAGSLHGELKPDGVSVTLISPGFVASDIRRTDNEGLVHATSKDPIPAWIVAPVGSAAREIVRSIERRKREAVITFHGKILVLLYRHVPWFVHLIFGLGLRGRRSPRRSD